MGAERPKERAKQAKLHQGWCIEKYAVLLRLEKCDVVDYAGDAAISIRFSVAIRTG